MDDPDVVAGIDVDANSRAEHPMIRQRLGPQWIDLEAWRLNGPFALGRRGLLELALGNGKRAKHAYDGHPHHHITLTPHRDSPSRARPLGHAHRRTSQPAKAVSIL
jgi:hypothetical protein